MSVVLLVPNRLNLLRKVILVDPFLHDFNAMPDLSKRPDQVAKEGNAYRVRGGEEDLKSAMEKYDKARIIHSLHGCKAPQRDSSKRN